jgi:hypothetical protein
LDCDLFLLRSSFTVGGITEDQIVPRQKLRTSLLFGFWYNGSNVAKQYKAQVLMVVGQSYLPKELEMVARKSFR